MAERTAILFFTHVFDRESLARLEKLQREAAGYGDLFILSSAPGEVPAAWRPRAHGFDFDVLRARYPKVRGDQLLQGNCHLAHLDFFRSHPDYDFYWTIEYDVVFTGSWAVFFDAFRADPADLLGSHLRTYGEEPEWAWWRSLKPPPGIDPLPLERLIRAFFPAIRLSRRALEVLEARSREGWWGHFELLIPTLTQEAGLTLADLGGRGAFTPAVRRNRFYTSFDWGEKSLFYLGSMRYRPPLRRPGGRRNFLYHPLKPGEPDPGAIRRDQLERRSFLAAELKRNPLRLLRALWAMR